MLPALCSDGSDYPCFAVSYAVDFSVLLDVFTGLRGEVTPDAGGMNVRNCRKKLADHA
ncbi:MAG: hypothetical protein ABI144_05870 [Gallionella sp.]